MKKRTFVVGFAIMALVYGMMTTGCTSTGNSSNIPNNSLLKVVGTWRGFDRNGGGVLDINSNGNGTLKMYLNGTLAIDLPVKVSPNGQISINNKNVQHTLSDVIVNEIYLGEKLTVTGFIDSALIFYKTNPSDKISLAGTSWTYGYKFTVYTFNDDGSFVIDLHPAAQEINNVQWHADTEGTYSINGIEVILNYPKGRGFRHQLNNRNEFVIDGVEKNSDRIFIEGAQFLLGAAKFGLISE